MKNHRGQSGRLLLEFIIMIGLIAAFSPVFLRKMIQRSNELDDVAIAAQMRTLSHAVTAYIDTNLEVITRGGQVFHRDWQNQGGSHIPGFNYGSVPLDLTHPNIGQPIALEVTEFSDFLPTGYIGDSKIFQEFRIGMSRRVIDNNGVLEPKVHAMVITLPAIGRIDPVRGARISYMIGSGGGYVYPGGFPGASSRKALGYQGAWELDLAPFFGDAIVNAGGAVVAVAGRDLDQAYIPKALYRYQMAGFPDANTMRTTLDMSERDITDIGAMDAQYIGLRDVDTACDRKAPDFENCIRMRHGISIDGEKNMIIFNPITGDRNVNIMVDGNTGRISFGQYFDPLRDNYTLPYIGGEEQSFIVRPSSLDQNVGGLEFQLDPDGSVRRDARGRPVVHNQVKPDAVSAVDDIRIRELGGAKLSELLPKLIHRHLYKYVENGTFIPAPGFVVQSTTPPSFSLSNDDKNRLCPVGHAPVISVIDAENPCGDVPTSGPLTLSQRRCLWPNPDYIPVISYHAGLSSSNPIQYVRQVLVNSQNNDLPLNRVVVDRYAIANISQGSTIRLFGGIAGEPGTAPNSPVRIFDSLAAAAPHSQTVFNITMPGNTFAKQWDNIEPQLVREGYVPFYNKAKCYDYATSGSTADIRCQNDAVFGKIYRDNFGVNMEFSNDYVIVGGVTPPGNIERAVGFELCTSESIEIMPRAFDSRLKYLNFRQVTSPDCPISEGWGYVMRNRKGVGSASAPQGSFYFIRIPVLQFSRIGGQEVTGPMSGGTVFNYQPVYDAGYTSGWHISVQEGKKVNVDVYCRYIPEAFEGLRR